MQQGDDRAGGFADDRVDQSQGVLGAGAESDEGDVGPFTSGDRANVSDLDFARDDLVAESHDDWHDQLKAVFAFVGDQDAQMVCSVPRWCHKVDSKTFYTS